MFGDRGGSGLTAEPAGAALVIMQFIGLFRYFNINNVFKKHEKYLWGLLILVLIISNTSGTLGLFLIMRNLFCLSQFAMPYIFDVEKIIGLPLDFKKLGPRAQACSNVLTILKSVLQEPRASMEWKSG